MGLSAAGLVPTLDVACKSLTLAGAGHIDLVAGGKGVCFDNVADSVLCAIVEFEFFNVAVSLNACLPEVTHLGLGDEFFADGLECHLNGIVAVVLNRFNLSDGAGSCQNNGHGDHRSVLTEKLSHADFLPRIACFIVCTSEITA